MAGKLKPLDVERETRPGKYADGDGLYPVGPPPPCQGGRVPRPPVCTENLSTAIVVMKSAQDGASTDHTGSLNWARNRRILVQRSMCSVAIVVIGVRF
jgi:hypothetical protein